MSAGFLIRREHSRGGSTLLVALTSTAALSVVAGYFILNITGRSQTGFRSASWHEAAMAAESAADVAVAEIRRVLPEINPLPNDRWSGWTTSAASLPTSRLIPTGVTLTLPLPALVHGGEGNTLQTATVTLEAPAGLVDAGGNQWFRLQTKGTALVPGKRHAAMSRLDNRLRRLALVRDGSTGTIVARPRVSRSFEVIVRPVLPFQTGVITEGSIDAPHRHAVVDSFDSDDPRKSSGGEYDSRKRQAGASIFSNGPDFTFGGEIHGNAGTNGGALEKTSDITGTVTNGFYQSLPAIQPPAWERIIENPSTVTSSATLTAGPPANPRRYKLQEVSGDLTISRGSQSPGATVEIWVTGDITGTIRVDPGVTAVIYVAGNVRMDARDIDNSSHRAADLQIYGIQPPTGQSRSIEIDLGRDVQAAVYAPGHSIRLNGHGDWMGSIAGKSLRASGKARFHYDEALTHRAGVVIDYKVASCIETTP